MMSEEEIESNKDKAAPSYLPQKNTWLCWRLGAPGLPKQIRKNRWKKSEDGSARKENNCSVKKYDIKDSEDGRERKENHWSFNKDIKDREDGRERNKNKLVSQLRHERQ